MSLPHLSSGRFPILFVCSLFSKFVICFFNQEVEILGKSGVIIIMLIFINYNKTYIYLFILGITNVYLNYHIFFPFVLNELPRSYITVQPGRSSTTSEQ